jgi:SAM-dependent methyltransferase
LRMRDDLSMTESYTKTKIGAWQRIGEFIALYRFHSADIELQVAGLIRTMKTHESAIERRLGGPLRNRSILEIGPGQMLKQARFFGAHNKVIAVDLDEVITGWHARVWWRMFRANGLVRLLKTLVRKVIGIDRRFTAELERQMPATARPSIRILQRDAGNTGLESESFDCAISFSVLEHISDPRLVMREIVRLLRPRGVSYHVVHNYTSDTGAHDPRSYIAGHGGLPYWCHLRSDKAHLSASNTFVNKMSLADWKNIAREEFPGVEIRSIVQDDIPELAEELAKLRASGELANYSDEELMTVCLVLIWTKPGGENATRFGRIHRWATNRPPRRLTASNRSR